MYYSMTQSHPPRTGFQTGSGPAFCLCSEVTPIPYCTFCNTLCAALMLRCPGIRGEAGVLLTGRGCHATASDVAMCLTS